MDADLNRSFGYGKKSLKNTVMLRSFRLQTLLLCVGMIGGFFGMARFAWETIHDLPFMPNISLLNKGQPVVVYEDCALPRGPRGIVVDEPAWDGDSCYPAREISVKLTSGPKAGALFPIPRQMLRER